MHTWSFHLWRMTHICSGTLLDCVSSQAGLVALYSPTPVLLILFRLLFPIATLSSNWLLCVCDDIDSRPGCLLFYLSESQSSALFFPIILSVHSLLFWKLISYKTDISLREPGYFRGGSRNL